MFNDKDKYDTEYGTPIFKRRKIVNYIVKCRVLIIWTSYSVLNIAKSHR